jgi:ATP-binding cassette subfamily F protein uup
MDEPTNDLDAETLELLEELLIEYQGTLLLVSHDRAFLNNVVTSTIVFEGDGRVIEYAGGYDDWLIQKPKRKEPLSPQKNAGKKTRQKPMPSKPAKLGYMQKRELNDLPKKIDTLESRQKELFEAMSDPLFYKKGKAEIARVKAHLDRVENEIETAYLRWEELENMGARG